MRHNFFLLPLALVFLAGCASALKCSAPRPANLFPADAFQTHRAIFTALGHQYTFNGYLSLSKDGGKRLVIMENFGRVLADVLVKPDGEVFVMQDSKAFKAERIRRFIAADLETIFGERPVEKWRVQMPDPNHFVLQRRWYSLDLRVIASQAGEQSPTMFDATKALK